MGAGQTVLAIDQGTTSSRALLFDEAIRQGGLAQQEFRQIYPRSGWVEHDPEAIWHSTLSVAREAVAQARAKDLAIAALGITNQRETTLVWDRSTGEAVYNAIVWQDRRTSALCERLNADGLEAEVQSRSGLLIDPYFSATKIAWILDQVEGARRRAERGELLFGTVDTYLIWRLTGGRVHRTDATNASRTNLYNIHQGAWDPALLEIFRIPEAMLPEVCDCAADFGHTDPALLGLALPILGVAGDQQAASIGQCCFEPGQIKSTYGTGCFVLLNTGDTPLTSRHRLLTTVAWQLDGQVRYALEGSIFIAGAAVQWLRDQLGVIRSAEETEDLAKGLDDNAGVYLVPAFTGLGVPYWQPEARGAIFGLTRASGRAELARAALESVCYQTHDLLRAMQADGVSPTSLRVDGGMVANRWMLQFLADVLDIEVLRPQQMETTALGAGYLAGRQAGLYGDFDQFARQWTCESRFTPSMTTEMRQALLTGWARAVSRVTQADGADGRVN